PLRGRACWGSLRSCPVMEREGAIYVDASPLKLRRDGGRCKADDDSTVQMGRNLGLFCLSLKVRAEAGEFAPARLLCGSTFSVSASPIIAPTVHAARHPKSKIRARHTNAVAQADRLTAPTHRG